MIILKEDKSMGRVLGDNADVDMLLCRAMAKMEGMKVVVNALVGALPR